MASVPIGGVRVDLQLNSAAFIRDIAKSNAAVASSTKTMTGHLNRLATAAKSTGAAFTGWLTVRAARQVINFFDRSIELASKLDNQLGHTAKAFEVQGAAMRNAFELGAAQGFLDVFTAGAQNSTERLEQMAKAGAVIGTVFGAAATVAVDVFTIVIPKAIEISILGINKLVEGANATIAALESIDNLLGLQKDYGRIPIIPVTDIEAGATAFFGLDSAARLAADATNLAAQSQEKLGKSLQGTHYEIMQQLKDLDDMSTVHLQASLKTTNQWLTAADTMGQALATMFKDNKAVAIAQAVINTAQAITGALALLPNPVAWVQAAAAAALGAAQIATIVSTNPGSGSKSVKGGSGKSKGGGGGVASAGAASTAARPAAGGGGFTQAVTIEILGDVFGPEHFRKMVAGINDVQRDGTALLRFA